MNKKRSYNIIEPMLLIAAFAIFLSFCTDMTGETLRRPAYFFGLLAAFIVCFVFRKHLPKEPVIWVFISGALVKAAYIIYTPVWERQHDVISFGAGEGHAAYIEYILTNKSLPNFDPRLVWGFFQPPLHHFICAVWMWINIRLKISERQLQENVQVLTLVYMLVLTLITYFICKELMMQTRGILITMLITSFHPMYILLSGSINNDALSICLSGIAVYIAILWYKKPSVKTILLLALCIGLGMSAKLSAGLAAPGIGAMMIYKFIDKRKEWVKYLLQYILFGLVVFPLGLWWSIRNKIMWDMPFNYIPEVGEQLTHSSLISRLFDIRTGTVYPCMINNGDAYDEYNVFLAMIKTSLFGESDFGQISPIITVFAVILFACAVILVIMQLAAFIWVLADKQTLNDIGYKLILGGSALSIFAGYMMFALSYNNFSAQDFRYAALLVSLSAVFLGLWDDRLSLIGAAKGQDDKKVKKIRLLRGFILVTAAVFAISSAAVYILVGLLA